MTKPDKYLVYTAENISAVATHKNDVIIELKLPDAGLLPGVTLAFRMLPGEARTIAKLLVQTADDIEGKQH